MGRVKLIDKGPRNIDLDILLFGETQHADDRLQIPHALMFEREFVLRPLSECVLTLTSLISIHLCMANKRQSDSYRRITPSPSHSSTHTFTSV